MGDQPFGDKVIARFGVQQRPHGKALDLEWDIHKTCAERRSWFREFGVTDYNERGVGT